MTIGDNADSAEAEMSVVISVCAHDAVNQAIEIRS
jgi:hypothetical protein